ncbi:solute carrier family 28 member 3-like [Mya arenaria]|uniref:solute carrier family 28 member 3-like n=1 Tax=Mya arenaria TaxID=6604 RepID=UPI0022E2D534|nr:solute carrier family 28 member 3-like [Mya arenaria]
MSGSAVQLNSWNNTDGSPPSYNSTGNTNSAFVHDENAKYVIEKETELGGKDTSEKNGNLQNDETDEVKQYEESSDEEDDEIDNKCSRAVGGVQRNVFKFCGTHKLGIKILLAVIFGCLYCAYFIYAMIKYFDPRDEGMVRLLWFTLAVAFLTSGILLKDHVIKDKWSFDCLSGRDGSTSQKVSRIIYWFLVIGTIIFVIVFVIVDIGLKKPDYLRSASGIFAFVALFYIFSYKPSKVKFRPVFWGLAIQFYFALLILRTNWGYTAFQWLGDRIREFLEHTDAGAKFVFGEDTYTMHFFAFKVLTVVTFFSAFVSMLYYAGVMQFIIRHIARFLSFCLDTSPTESLNAAGNIFIGQGEAPLMIRPFIKDMTRSELHAVCTGGFATIAGAVMAAYINMGVPANHLLSASVMSAPAALAMAKLFWPETKKSKARAEDVYNMKKGTEHNVIEAASNGASVSIKLIANIAVNLIAFIAILDFINATLKWFGHRVNMHDPELTFSLICSYVFYPIAYVMGCSLDDVFKVASLLGTKTFLNEFVAYSELSVYITNRETYDSYIANALSQNITTEISYQNDDLILGNNITLSGGLLSDRSTVISTYALCGFSNLSSIGIMIGALGAMAPSRKSDITRVVVRAMIAGNVACFMTACIAGLLYNPE